VGRRDGRRPDLVGAGRPRRQHPRGARAGRNPHRQAAVAHQVPAFAHGRRSAAPRRA
jgi:hypothetical protein